jgi:hypothetical protein
MTIEVRGQSVGPFTSMIAVNGSKVRIPSLFVSIVGLNIVSRMGFVVNVVRSTSTYHVDVRL